MLWNFSSKDIQPVLHGVAQGVFLSRHHVIHSFIIIPIGILILLVILYGFNVLITDIAQIKFPSSVLCMLINLIMLISLSAVSKLQSSDKSLNHTWNNKIGSSASWIMKYYLMIIRPPMNFSLKWINVFFIPSFIILPLSDSITFIECMKIAAVFLIGGIALMVTNVYMILSLKKAFSVFGFSSFDSKKDDPKIYSEDAESAQQTKEDVELLRPDQSYILAREDITTIDASSLRPSQTEPKHEIGHFSRSGPPSVQQGIEVLDLQTYTTAPVQISAHNSPRIILDMKLTHKNDPECELSSSSCNILKSMSSPDKLSGTSKRIADFITSYIDWILYGTLFVIALPFYYVSTIHVMLPFHLGLTVISYYNAVLLLERYPVAKKFAHPILVSTVEVLFVCFISSLIYHRGSPKGFLDDLKYYKTGKNYLTLFSGKPMYNNGKVASELQKNFTSQPMWPGCGDILSSLMDISIVSLSLPMFTHRRDFVKNFWLLVPALLASMALTFFCYPIICYKLGISSERSLGFIGRSVTLALGTPLINSLGGSVSLMAVCTILSGIFGVLIGDSFFKVLRIPSNDFVTRGVTLGVNCGAIATGHLLKSDPRAASMSSLSFSLFGTIMIILSSIGTIRELIRSWVGL